MKKLSLAICILSCCAFVVSMSAASVTGQANFSGAPLTITDTSVSFGPNAGQGALNAVTIEPPKTGSFVTLSGASILNLFGLTPGISVNDTHAAIFNEAAGPIYFDVQSALPGYGTAAGCTPSAQLGSVCTPAGTMYTLTSATTITGEPETLALFALSGTAYLGSAATGSALGLLAAQSLVALPLDAVVSELATGVQLPTYGATFVATQSAPEPATLGLASIGAIAVAAFGLRRRRSGC